MRSRFYQKNALTSENLGERLVLLEKEVKKFMLACKEDETIPIFVLLDLEPDMFTNAIIALLRQKFPDLLVIDFPSFMVKKGGNKFRIPNDGHPDARAHQIIANVLMDQLITIIRFRSSLL